LVVFFDENGYAVFDSVFGSARTAFKFSDGRNFLRRMLRPAVDEQLKAGLFAFRASKYTQHIFFHGLSGNN
jgi:hypothetical protein